MIVVSVACLRGRALWLSELHTNYKFTHFARILTTDCVGMGPVRFVKAYDSLPSLG